MMLATSNTIQYSLLLQCNVVWLFRVFVFLVQVLSPLVHCLYLPIANGSIHMCVCMPMYIHIYMYVHTYTHAYAHIYTCACTHTRTHVHTHTYMYTRTHNTHTSSPAKPHTELLGAVLFQQLNNVKFIIIVLNIGL